MSEQDQDQATPLNRRWLWAIILLGVLPSLVTLVAIPLGKSPFDSAYLYSLVQICGFCVAAFVAILCFVHFSRSGEVTSPILGLGMLCVGVLDLWQPLASQLFFTPENAEVTRQFIPLTWTMSRGIYAALLILAAIISPMSRKIGDLKQRRKGLRIVVGIGVVVIIVTGLLVYLCISRPEFLADLYGSERRKAVWNFAPLFLVLLAGLYILPTYNLWHNNMFSKVLIYSCIPLVLAQIHFVFGSAVHQPGTTDLFDLHFGTANILKMMAYIIPLIGLMIDYERTYTRIEKTNKELQSKLFEIEGLLAKSKMGNLCFTAFMDCSPSPACLLDTSLRAIQLSPTQAKVSGIGVAVLGLGKDVATLYGDAAGSREEHCKKVLESGLPSRSALETYTYPDGKEHRFHWIVSPVRDKEATVALICFAYTE